MRTDRQWTYDEKRRQRSIKQGRDHLAAYAEGRTWAEIAEREGVSETTIYRRVKACEEAERVG